VSFVRFRALLQVRAQLVEVLGGGVAGCHLQFAIANDRGGKSETFITDVKQDQSERDSQKEFGIDQYD
jgi:hypothetical protein